MTAKSLAVCSGLFFSVLLGYHLWYYYCTGLGCLLWYLAQVFWVRELRPVQLELKLVRLVRKLCLVCQEHAYCRQNVVLVLYFCCRRNFSPVFAAKWTFLQFLLQKELFSSFYHMTDFSIMQQNFLLCNKVSCCAVKLSAVYWSCMLCIKAVYRALRLSVVLYSFLPKAFCYALRLSAML